ncbi:hypothetical protein DB347_20945 [Opitutaceae bacterium EW11]|nr:hypothetical protein DB347_20945 [Opitutaceae bacterium EW11]
MVDAVAPPYSPPAFGAIGAPTRYRLGAGADLRVERRSQGLDNVGKTEGVRRLPVLRHVMRYLFFLPGLILGMSGCATPDSGSAPATAPAKAAPTKSQTAASGAPAGSILGAGRDVVVTRSKFQVGRGMTAEQLREKNGAPESVKPMEAPSGKAEIWTYNRPAGSIVKQVVTRIEEVPYTDPLTGVSRMVKQPVYGQEQHVISEEIQVLLFEGIVVEAKTLLTERTSFHQ